MRKYISASPPQCEQHSSYSTSRTASSTSSTAYGQYGFQSQVTCSTAPSASSAAPSMSSTAGSTSSTVVRVICHVASCRVVSSHVMSCHVTSRRVMSCHVICSRVTFCRVMLSRVMSCVMSVLLTPWAGLAGLRSPDIAWCEGLAREDAPEPKQRRVANWSAGAKGRARLLCAPLSYTFYTLETSATGSPGYYLVAMYIV